VVEGESLVTLFSKKGRYGLPPKRKIQSLYQGWRAIMFEPETEPVRDDQGGDDDDVNTDGYDEELPDAGVGAGAADL
jgi:hypothetical protein